MHISTFPGRRLQEGVGTKGREDVKATRGEIRTWLFVKGKRTRALRLLVFGTRFRWLSLGPEGLTASWRVNSQGDRDSPVMLSSASLAFVAKGEPPGPSQSLQCLGSVM